MICSTAVLVCRFLLHVQSDQSFVLHAVRVLCNAVWVGGRPHEVHCIVVTQNITVHILHRVSEILPLLVLASACMHEEAHTVSSALTYHLHF